MTLRRSTALTRLVVLLCAATAALAIPRKGGSRIDTFLETSTTATVPDISYLDSVSIKESSTSKYVYAWATSGTCSEYPVAGANDEMQEFQFVSTSSETADSSITYGTSIYLKSTVLDSYMVEDAVMKTGGSYGDDDIMEIKLYLESSPSDTSSTITAGDSVLIYSVDQGNYLNCSQDTACEDSGTVSKKFCQFNTASEDDAESFTIDKDTSVDLYHYYDSTNVDHFYTTTYDELSSSGSYEYIETVGKCYATQKTDTVALYRAFWNGTQVDHFYTKGYDEYSNLASAYDPEGVECYVYSSEPSDVTSVYLGRFGNAFNSTTDHFYPTSSDIASDETADYTDDDDISYYDYDDGNNVWLYKATVKKYFYLVAPDEE